MHRSRIPFFSSRAAMSAQIHSFLIFPNYNGRPKCIRYVLSELRWVTIVAREGHRKCVLKAKLYSQNGPLVAQTGTKSCFCFDGHQKSYTVCFLLGLCWGKHVGGNRGGCDGATIPGQPRSLRRRKYVGITTDLLSVQAPIRLQERSQQILCCEVRASRESNLKL